MAAPVTRSRYHGSVETSEETVIHGRTAHRRATLEEQLAVAVAHGDAERVSRIRAELAQLEAAR